VEVASNVTYDYLPIHSLPFLYVERLSTNSQLPIPIFLLWFVLTNSTVNPVLSLPSDRIAFMNAGLVSLHRRIFLSLGALAGFRRSRSSAVAVMPEPTFPQTRATSRYRRSGQCSTKSDDAGVLDVSGPLERDFFEFGTAVGYGYECIVG
jgi:hypothetical protein